MRFKWLPVIMLFVVASASSQTTFSEGVDSQFLIGNYEYRENPFFVEVSREHASRALFLQNPVYDAFIEMFEQAKRDGITLKIVSGTRNFNEQKAIWEKKWKKLKDLCASERAAKILEFSSMPATSRHHWGTDLDLNNLENSYFESGKGKEEYDWLVTNAGKYGFHQVYTSKSSGRTGYDEEKWHWSFMPLASIYLHAYNEQIKYTDIQGFEGADLAEEIGLITNYVNGIAPQPRAVRLASIQAQPAVPAGSL